MHFNCKRISHLSLIFVSLLAVGAVARPQQRCSAPIKSPIQPKLSELVILKSTHGGHPYILLRKNGKLLELDYIGDPSFPLQDLGISETGQIHTTIGRYAHSPFRYAVGSVGKKVDEVQKDLSVPQMMSDLNNYPWEVYTIELNPNLVELCETRYNQFALRLVNSLD